MNIKLLRYQRQWWEFWSCSKVGFPADADANQLTFKRFNWIGDKHWTVAAGKIWLCPQKVFIGVLQIVGIGQHTHKPIRWAWRSSGADVRWEGGRVQVKGVLEEDVRSVNWEWPRALAWNLSHNAPIRSTPFNITLEDHDHRGDRSHALRWPWSSSLSSKAITMTMAAIWSYSSKWNIYQKWIVNYGFCLTVSHLDEHCSLPHDIECQLEKYVKTTMIMCDKATMIWCPNDHWTDNVSSWIGKMITLFVHW